jgi:hypothetical protein
MWSTEKFGAVSGRRQGAALGPPIFLSPTPRFGSGTRLMLIGFCRLLSPFLPGSASQVEMAVTHSKQRRGPFLPGSRIACKASSKMSQFSLPQLSTGRLATCHSPALTKEGPLACPDERRATEFLTETAPHSKTTVTNSKQTTETFLTGARIAHTPSSNWPKFSAECVQEARVAVNGSRLSPASSLSLALTKEGPLATAFRYNAPGPTSPARHAT